MRILMTADTVGGVWTYAVELIRQLSRDGVNVALATMGRPLSRSQQADVDGIEGLQVHASNFKLEWMDDPWDDVEKAGRWLLEIAEDFSPDVVHLNGYAHAALPWKAPVLVVGHSCVLSWWQAVKGEPAPAQWTDYRNVVAAGLRAADFVAAPTQAMMAELDRLYGPLSRKSVIPNGRQSSLFSPAAKEPIVFAAGRVWDEAKNIATLARSAMALPWPVYVAGDASHPGGGDANVKHVRALGQLPPAEVARWLGRAWIYALPARYEPFGLSALEAALAGCCLVLGDIPSLREVWGEAALYVPPDDADALQQAIERLADDERLRHQQAARARVRALQYTPYRMARNYMVVYRWLAVRAQCNPIYTSRRAA